MPYIKIWIHTVWSTYNRKPFLEKDFRGEIFNHIKENSIKKGIYIDHINGYLDHVHCLISLGLDQNIAALMQLVKGESSHWINQQKYLKTKFSWQEEYFAVSIGESQLGMVRKYIQNQEEHHSKASFQQEYDELISRYGFKTIG